MSTEKQLNKVRSAPPGVAACVPTPNVNPEKRRKSSIRKWLGKALARFQSRRMFKELMRLRGISRYWVNRGNRDGVHAECALLIAIMDNLDAGTWQSIKNLELLSDQAGLTTTSTTGGKSYSRASRAAERLAQLGIIRAPKAGFMPHLKTCEIRYIDVTEKFFELMGVALKDATRERARLVNVPAEAAHTVTVNHPAIIKAYIERRAKMAAAGFARLKARRERTKQERADRRQYATP
jgi:hypothetical protein